MTIHHWLIAGLLTIACGSQAAAQRILSIEDHACAPSESGVHVSPIYSDSLSSSFLICIDKEVKPHVHRTHTEHVFVLDGQAVMRLGDAERPIKTGDVVVIPAGTVHAVVVTGTAPLRVISVQAPHFDGSDRVVLPE